LTRNVATEACRRASNGLAFVERVYAETGIALDVISPAEEARLAVLGCHVLIDPAGAQALVFDIGGGSTELMLVGATGDGGGPPEIIDWISMPWGVVSLAETEPQWPDAHDRLSAYERMLGEVQPLLAGFAKRLTARGITDVQLLGTSGTITTLASVQLGLPVYDRRRVDGCAVGTSELSVLCRSIGLRSVADRARIACVGPDRAELIVAGCAILEAILTRWPGGEVKVADRGIREGILRTLMTRDGVWMPK
jgi:exopolyphosphatase/guanosine-5'-triphosphate,3'-diphosphate pyrophosphatase